MGILFWLAAGLAAIFAASLIIVLNFYHKSKKSVKVQEETLTRKDYELSLLNALSDKIGYSLNIPTIAETIAQSVKDLPAVTTVSYAMMEENKITFQFFLKEGTQVKFLDEVEKIMSDSITDTDGEFLTAIHTRLENKILVERYSVLPSDTTPLSHFNLPLSVNNKLVGMITIASRYENAFEEKDMTLLNTIVGRASTALSGLAEVILTEQGKLSSLIASLPIGVIMLKPEKDTFQIAHINQAAKNLLVLPDATEFSHVSRVFSNTEVASCLARVVKDKKNIVINEIPIHDHYCTIYLSPVLFDDTGRLIGISIVIEDVTFEKQHQKMGHDFTDMVVHELRAPLTSIRGSTSLLLQSGIQDTQRSKIAKLIFDSTSQMIQQVGDLLDATKIEQQEFKIHKQNADMNAICAQKIEIFSPIAAEKNMKINFEKESNLHPFLFDPNRIGQVITNLLSNSVKYTEAEGSITLKTGLDGSCVKVSITDSGIGMPADKLNLLFSKFGQMHDDLLHQGSGIGLFVTKGIIDSHGGKIWVNSQEGVGTTISFELPYIAATETTGDHPASISSIQKMTN